MLYRYRKLNEYTYQTLENDEFWISSSDTFNDLFDIQIAYNKGKISEKLYSNDAFRKGFLKYKEKYNYLNKTEDEQFLGYIDFVCLCFILNIKRKVLVCSLTPYDDNAVMWSHYADDSKGYVVGYNEVDIEKLIGGSIDKMCFKVNYKKEPFDATLLIIKSIEDSISETKDIFDIVNAYYKFEDLMFHGDFDKHFYLRKTEEWGYEEEVRFLRYYGPSTGNEHQILGKIKPAKIIIGQKMEIPEKLKIFHLAITRNIPLYKSEVSWDLDTYGIKIDKFTSDDLQDLTILINDQLNKFKE